MKRKQKMRLLALVMALIVTLGMFLGTSLPVRAAEKNYIAITADNFPDAGFREYLMTYTRFSSFRKEEKGVTYIDANRVTSFSISRDWTNIKSLEGIEKFTGLMQIALYDTNIDKLDLSQNKELYAFQCFGASKLEGFDFSKNTNLWIVTCQRIENMKSLDISNLPNLERLELQANDNLKNLSVCHNEKLKYMNCYEGGIENLIVRDNASLTGVYCYNNKIKRLEISDMPNLVDLVCYNNKLKTLEINNVEKLSNIYCYGNCLTALDVSGIDNLKTLSCYDNQIKTLKAPAGLSELSCYKNRIEKLDLKQFENAQKIVCDFYSVSSTGVDCEQFTNKKDVILYVPEGTTTLDLSNFKGFEAEENDVYLKESLSFDRKTKKLTIDATKGDKFEQSTGEVIVYYGYLPLKGNVKLYCVPGAYNPSTVYPEEESDNPIYNPEGGTPAQGVAGAVYAAWAPPVDVTYHTHIQTYGDSKPNARNGQMSGTSGESKRLENIWIRVNGNPRLGIQYTTHCQTYGWLPWSANGEENGTTGESKRLEAIKIQLTGEDRDEYDVYYRVHAQTYGWLGWAKNGEPAGTAGYSKRLEGIQIVVLPKKSAAPGIDYMGVNASGMKRNEKAYIAKNGSSPVVNAQPTSATNPVIPGEKTVNVAYKTHVQTYGWQGWKYNGQMSGTSGKSKRLEGINVKLTNQLYAGDIAYITHVQKYGWQGDENNIATWKKNGEMSGTSGEAKRLEAIRIALTGEMARHYDVYYRVHSQTYGWLGWAKNGEAAGTAGLSKRLEGIQIVLVPKGGAAPTNDYGGVVSKKTEAYIKK